MTAVWTGRHAWAIYKLNRGVGDTVFYDAAGRPWFRLDEQRRDVPFEQISTYFKDAVIAVEDHRFYLHPGIDPIALGRAVALQPAIRDRARRAAAPSRSSSRGRCSCRTRAPTAARCKEAALAVMLEIFLSKREILQLYLNRVYLSGGIYGVETMSQKMLRQAGVAADARRGGAHRRHHPRAGVVLAVDAFRRRAAAQLRRAAADARGREDHGGAGAGGARASGSASSRRRR